MKKKVEAISRLSPQQQGMLFESLSASGSVLHVQQLVFDLDGDVDFSRFCRSWQQVVDRHQILRTAFAWKEQDEPLQVALLGLKLPVELMDWRGIPGEEQEERFEALLGDDLRKGFDLSKPPLMRIKLVRRDDRRHRLVWTFHHILIDGWCWPLLLSDFSSLYRAEGGGSPPLPPSRPYSDYIAWLARQDRDAAAGFWRNALQGVARPTSLGVTPDCPGAPLESPYGTDQIRVPAGATAALAAFARECRLTLNTVVQGIWALLLSRYSGQDDVVFGITVSGRPAELEGVETMIGLFINTLPLRLRLASDRPFSAWLRDVQRRQLDMSRYEHCSEGQIHQWSGIAGSSPLYESILVFENYPLPLSALRSSELDLVIHNSQFRGSFTKYPVSLLVAEAYELLVQITYDRRRVDDVSAGWILDQWRSLAESLAADPHQSLETLGSGIPADRIPRVQPVLERRRTPESDLVAPRTNTEEILASLWAEVLGVDPVGIHSNFFELGGHSLLALEILRRIRDTFRIGFSLRQLFEFPTVAEQAVIIAQRQAEQLDTESLNGLPGKLEMVSRPEARWEPFPLTPVQETYWAGRSGLFDLWGGTNVYQEFEVLGSYEAVMPRLEHAFRRLIGHHDMLRSVLQPSVGAVLQRVLPEVPPYEVKVVDLRGLDERAAAAEVGEMRRHLCTKVGEVERWPLFDIVAQRLDDGRIHLHTRFEPFLMDGEGRGHVVYQMLRLFEDPSWELPVHGCSYRDYVLTWSDFQRNEAWIRDREYWLQRLPGLPPAPRLPLSRKVDPPSPAHFVRQQAKLLDTEVWQRLKQRIARAGLTPSAVIIAAFAEVLAQWSPDRSFTLGAIGSYRPPIHPDIHELVANFNTISLLEVDRSAATFEERVRQLQKRIAADLEHPYFSGFELLRELNRRRGVSARTSLPVLFNSVIEYNHASYQREKSERLAECEAGRIRYLDLTMYPPQALLMTSVGEAPDGWLWARWQWAKDRLSEGLITEMREAYLRLLLGLIDREEPWREPLLALWPEDRRPPVLPGDLDRNAGAEGEPTVVADVLKADPTQGRAFSRYESEIADVWQEVLGVRPGRVSDDFFALGADSVAAVRLVRGIRERFGRDLPPGLLFQDGTLRTIARFVECP